MKISKILYEAHEINIVGIKIINEDNIRQIDFGFYHTHKNQEFLNNITLKWAESSRKPMVSCDFDIEMLNNDNVTELIELLSHTHIIIDRNYNYENTLKYLIENDYEDKTWSTEEYCSEMYS